MDSLTRSRSIVQFCRQQKSSPTTRLVQPHSPPTLFRVHRVYPDAMVMTVKTVAPAQRVLSVHGGYRVSWVLPARRATMVRPESRDLSARQALREPQVP